MNDRPRPAVRGGYPELATTAPDDSRQELIDEVRQALVDEINRQMIEIYEDKRYGLGQAQDIFNSLDMPQLATVAVDHVADRMALEIAKGITRLKEKAEKENHE